MVCSFLLKFDQTIREVFMLKKQIKGITVSGYLRLNTDLTVVESGGDSRALFGLPDKKEKTTFVDCISAFNNESQEELQNGLSRTREETRVTHCTLHHSGKKYLVTITPLTGGELILSFSLQEEGQTGAKDHENLAQTGFAGFLRGRRPPSDGHRSIRIGRLGMAC